MADKRNVFISHVHKDDHGLQKLKDLLAPKGGGSPRNCGVLTIRPGETQFWNLLALKIPDFRASPNASRPYGRPSLTPPAWTGLRAPFVHGMERSCRERLDFLSEHFQGTCSRDQDDELGGKGQSSGTSAGGLVHGCSTNAS